MARLLGFRIKNGIEEPENGLYHKLLESLATEFKRHATLGGTQVLVTTHSPHFVDNLSPNEVWLLEKSEKGVTSATRAADLKRLGALYEEGLTLGSLWYSNHFESTPRA